MKKPFRITYCGGLWLCSSSHFSRVFVSRLHMNLDLHPPPWVHLHISFFIDVLFKQQVQPPMIPTSNPFCFFTHVTVNIKATVTQWSGYFAQRNNFAELTLLRRDEMHLFMKILSATLDPVPNQYQTSISVGSNYILIFYEKAHETKNKSTPQNQTDSLTKTSPKKQSSQLVRYKLIKPH